MRYVVSTALVLALAGCAGQGPGFLQGFQSARPVFIDPGRAEPDPDGPTEPVAPVTVVPDDDARTAEEFDTTTAEDRQAALEPVQQDGDGRLGTTVASLGDPAEPGFWIKTPLVDEPMPGRIVYEKSGRSVQVELRPLDGPPGSGSQVSLAAMRLLDAPLTGLPELVVYKNQL